MIQPHLCSNCGYLTSKPGLCSVCEELLETAKREFAAAVHTAVSECRQKKWVVTSEDEAVSAGHGQPETSGEQSLVKSR